MVVCLVLGFMLYTFIKQSKCVKYKTQGQRPPCDIYIIYIPIYITALSLIMSII